MLPFLLYFVAAVLTGFHVYTLLTLAVYGVPFNLLHLISLLGSLCLVIAAFVSLFRPGAAAKIALLACLLIWCFYAPATAALIRAGFHRQTSVLVTPGPSRNLQAAFCRECGQTRHNIQLAALITP
jgi:hypothetical protein